MPAQSMHKVEKPLVNRIQPKVVLNRSLRLRNQPKLHISSPPQVAEIARESLTPIRRDVDFSPKLPDTITAPVMTAAKASAGRRDFVLASSTVSSPDVRTDVRTDGGILTNRLPAPGRGKPQSNAIASIVKSTDATDSADLSADRFTNLIMVPENKLGAVLVGERMDVQGHIWLKYSLSDWWQDPTAIPSFMKWLAEHTRLRADMKFAGGGASHD